MRADHDRFETPMLQPVSHAVRIAAAIEVAGTPPWFVMAGPVTDLVFVMYRCRNRSGRESRRKRRPTREAGLSWEPNGPSRNAVTGVSERRVAVTRVAVSRVAVARVAITGPGRDGPNSRWTGKADPRGGGQSKCGNGEQLGDAGHGKLPVRCQIRVIRRNLSSQRPVSADLR